MLRFWPLVLLTTAVLAFTACEDAQEVLPSATAPAQTAAQGSPTPTTLPSPAAGYKWIDVDLQAYAFPAYSVQIPEEWRVLSAGNPQEYGPEDATRLGPKLVTRVTLFDPTRTDPGRDQAFRNELPQVGTYCTISSVPPIRTSGYTWSSYMFTCGLEDFGSFVGRAAEVRDGDIFYSVLAYQPSGATTQAAFEEAVASFTFQ